MLAILLPLGFTGCGGETGHGEPYLLQVGKELHATRDDFKRFWDAYSAPIYANADMAALTAVDIKQTKMEAFDQFVIIMLMEARAEDLGIAISAEDLDAEVKKLKEDYSEDVFKDTLTKAVITEDLWREGLRRRLLMENVMRADLYSRGSITPEDVENYGGLRDGRTKANPEEVLERVYRAKAENDFQNWIQHLQNLYPVTINYEELASVLNE